MAGNRATHPTPLTLLAVWHVPSSSPVPWEQPGSSHSHARAPFHLPFPGTLSSGGELSGPGGIQKVALLGFLALL